jgi:hypothetical protein
MYTLEGAPILTDVTFISNIALAGAGMHNKNANPELTNVSFMGNLASGGGGGMYNERGSSPFLRNAVFSVNHANLWGGGLFNETNTMPVVLNSTFYGNSAGAQGGAMYSINDSYPTIINTIMWGNNAEEGSEIFNATHSAPVVSYSLIEGGLPPGTLDGGHNLDADPRFVDAPGGDLRLLAGSPAIDAGDSEDPNLPETDMDGNPRIVGAAVDMGAYEYQSVTEMPVDDVPKVVGIVSTVPNPFNPQTTITFEIPREQDVAVVVYDLLGRRVQVISEGHRSPGRHEVSWDGGGYQGRAMPSGTYLVRLETESGVEARKITLVR